MSQFRFKTSDLFVLAPNLCHNMPNSMFHFTEEGRHSHADKTTIIEAQALLATPQYRSPFLSPSRNDFLPHQAPRPAVVWRDCVPQSIVDTPLLCCEPARLTAPPPHLLLRDPLASFEVLL